MSDVQARVTGLLAEHRYVWTGKRCQCGQPCGYVEHPAHVAALLAEAGLLMELE